MTSGQHIEFSGRRLASRSNDASGISDRETSGRHVDDDDSVGADYGAVANDNVPKHRGARAHYNIVAETWKIAKVVARETSIFQGDGRVLQNRQVFPCKYRPNHNARWVRQTKPGADFCQGRDLAAIPQPIPSARQPGERGERKAFKKQRRFDPV
ncbi:MAG: hypothetical protein WA397_01845 [Roseiarcus sp.]